MDLRQLRHFIAVAEARSFTAAALALQISQPALSQSISRLEKDLDCTVFLRNKQNPGAGLLLTPAGTSLYTDARSILDAVDRASSRARRAGHSLERVRLAIGFSSSTPRHLIHAALTIPDVVRGVEVLPVHLVWGDDNAALLSGRVDLAFMQYPTDASFPSYVVAPLARSPRVAVFPAGHPAAARASVSMEDLADEPILDPGYGDDPLMHRSFWLAGARGPVVGPPVRTVEEMCAFVAAGMGMAITSGTIATQYSRPDLAFVPIERLEPVEVGLVRLREDERPIVMAVFDHLTALAAL